MDVIWNLTRVCPWKCSFCCVSAIHTSQVGSNESSCKYEIQKEELSFADKMRILDDLIENDCLIDFSGGDSLYYEDDYATIKKATDRLPADKVNISTTVLGATLDKIDVIKKAGLVEFTLDNLPEFKNPLRPNEFNVMTMRKIRELSDLGVKVAAVTVLHKYTADKNKLRKLYQWLCDNRVYEWDVLKYYPVGRGMKLNVGLKDKDCLAIMDFLRSLKGYTKINFQHTLKMLENKWQCPAGLESIGILSNGEVTACAWALDDNCRPFPGFSLGRLPNEKLEDILARAQSELGYGEKKKRCRIETFLYGDQRSKM